MSAFETPVYPGINLDDNYGPQLKAVGIAFTVISGTTVLLRFVSRVITHIPIERDDWLLLSAAIFCWAYNAVVMVEADYNFYGQHIGKSNPYHLEEYLKGLYSLAVVYPSALALSKLSLLALYWRIFRNSGAKRPIQVAAFLNIGWMIAAILVGLVSCRPVRGFWHTSIPSTCIQEYDFFLTNECLTIALDLVVLLIPLFSIAQIQRSLSQRISIGFTFGLGLVVIIISALRLWQLVSAQQRPGNDPTFNQTGAALWAIVEINTWIVVASIPALRPLVHDAYIRMKGDSRNGMTLVPSEGELERRRQKQSFSTADTGTKASKGSKGSKNKLKNFWFENETSKSEAIGSKEELAGRRSGVGDGIGGGRSGYEVHVAGGAEGPIGQAQSTWTPVNVQRSGSALGGHGYGYGGSDRRIGGRDGDVEMGRLPGIRVDREIYVGP